LAEVKSDQITSREELMAFVVAATWKARPGEEGRILGIIKVMTPLSRREPGNLVYQAQVSSQDPTRFLLYEQYTDARAYEDHKASQHFQQHVVGHALAYLEAREVSTYQTIDV
jgi:quinol monooxygenase YgiN